MSLRGTRIGSIPDIGRLAQALARPGIDTRTWISLGYACDESVTDKDHGEFVDVCLLPSNRTVTCRISQPYAGAGFGKRDGQIHKDDEVVVVFPDGDPAAGGVVVCRFNSASDLPPAEWSEDGKQGDLFLNIEKDKSLNLRLTGENGKVDVTTESDVTTTSAGNVTLKSDKHFTVEGGEKVTLKSGNVRLGSADATESVLKGDTYLQNEDTFLNQLKSAATSLQTAGGQLNAAGSLMTTPIYGAVAAAPLVLAAGGALTSAAATITAGCTAFSATATANKSTVSKTD